MQGAWKIGIIGGGAMAEAMIAGMTAEKGVPSPQIYVSDHKAARCGALHEQYHVNAQVGAENFLPRIDVLVLAVKPSAARAAMQETAPLLRRDALVISIVAGLTMAQIAAEYPGHPIVRAMPNTPLAVGAGMSAYACSDDADASAREAANVVLGTAGRVVEVKEHDLDAVTGLSGSGPAYAFLMIEALTDGGVAAGLRHETASLLAAQMVLDGAAPAALRAAVTSPAGTTAAGLRVMERAGVRSALIEAVLAAAERSKELGKQ